MKAVVMEIQDGKAVVLRRNGTFKEVPDRGYSVGQEIVISDVRPLRYAAAAASFFVVLGGSLVVHRMAVTPVSYVYMDINPSFRIELNRFDRVVDVVPLNTDAEEVLSTHPVRNRESAKCIGTIVGACREQTFINEDNKDVEISVHTERTSLNRSVEKEAEKLTKEELTVSVYAMDEEENREVMERQIPAKWRRAVAAYTELFGGTIEANMEALGALSADEILNIVAETQRSMEEAMIQTAEADTEEIDSSSQEDRDDAPSSAPQAPVVQDPAPAQPVPEEPSGSESDDSGESGGSGTSSGGASSKPKAEKKDTKKDEEAERTAAIEAFTECFGGTVDENKEKLSEVSVEDMLRMVEEQKAATEAAAAAAAEQPAAPAEAQTTAEQKPEETSPAPEAPAPADEAAPAPEGTAPADSAEQNPQATTGSTDGWADAVQAYTDCYGGTLEENAVALQNASTGEIKKKTDEAKKASAE